MGSTRTGRGCRGLIRAIVGRRRGRRLTGVRDGGQWTNYGQSSSASAAPLVGVDASSVVGNHWSVVVVGVARSFVVRHARRRVFGAISWACHRWRWRRGDEGRRRRRRRRRRSAANTASRESRRVGCWRKSNLLASKSALLLAIGSLSSAEFVSQPISQR